MPISTILPHNDVEWRIKIVMTQLAPAEPSTTITDADGNELEERPNQKGCMARHTIQRVRQTTRVRCLS